jgi:hypothetical protein
MLGKWQRPKLAAIAFAGLAVVRVLMRDIVRKNTESTQAAPMTNAPATTEMLVPGPPNQDVRPASQAFTPTPPPTPTDQLFAPVPTVAGTGSATPQMLAAKSYQLADELVKKAADGRASPEVLAKARALRDEIRLKECTGTAAKLRALDTALDARPVSEQQDLYIYVAPVREAIRAWCKLPEPHSGLF